MSDSTMRMLRWAFPITLILWALILWLILAFTSSARAAENAAFISADAAAQAALTDCADRSRTTEYAGVIYQIGDTYAYTEPQEGDETHFKIVARFPRGARLVAIYHTHPGADAGAASEFSSTDKHVSKDMKLPSYIRALASGEVYKLKVNGSVDELAGPARLCHGMLCADYYKLQQHLALVAMGIERR